MHLHFVSLLALVDNLCNQFKKIKLTNNMPICVKEYQGNKRNNQAKMQGNEHIRGLISWYFIFLKMGMLGTLIIGPNTFQIPLCAKC